MLRVRITPSGVPPGLLPCVALVALVNACGGNDKHNDLFTTGSGGHSNSSSSSMGDTSSQGSGGSPGTVGSAGTSVMPGGGGSSMGPGNSGPGNTGTGSVDMIDDMEDGNASIL